MSTLHRLHPVEGRTRVTRDATAAVWTIALGVIAAYAFFVALGAFAPADVPWLSVAVAVLVGLWMLHAWTGSRRPRATRDLRLVHSRGRRIL